MLAAVWKDESGVDESLLQKLQEPGQVHRASVRVLRWLVSKEELPTFCSKFS